MSKEKVSFEKGLSSAIPLDKIAGRFLVETDTGNMYLDTSENERIQIKDSTKATKEHFHSVAALTDTLPISQGGTGGIERAAALYNLSKGSYVKDSDGNNTYDLNLYTDIGYYYFSGSTIPTNAPPTKLTGYLIVLRGGGDGRKQIWMPQTSDATVQAEVYVRTMATTWQPWTKVTNANDLANYLSLSGGEMTAPISSSVVTDKYLAGNQGTAIINSTATGYVALAKLNSTNGYFTIASHGNKMLVTYTDKATVEAGTNSTTKTLQLITEDGSSKFNDVYSNNKLVVTEGRLSGSTVGKNSVAIGIDNTASGSKAVALGDTNIVTSTGYALGHNNTVGTMGFGIGYSNTCRNTYSFAYGTSNTSSGPGSMALGYHTEATEHYATSMGFYTTNNSYAALVCGRYNKSLTPNTSASSSAIGDVFAIGNGIADSSTVTNNNAFRVTYTGVVYGQGAYNTSGADYAEFVKPWFDNNPDAEDRVGYFVTLKDGYLHKANEGDYVLGVTSGNPSIVGNADEDYYWKYVRDEFNRYIYEDVEEEVQATDDEGNLLYNEDGSPIYVKTGNIIKNGRIKLSENYDPSLQDSYIERSQRPEWDYVGMRGIIPVRDDGTCEVGSFCKCGVDGIATKAEIRGFDTYYVIERISDNVISIEVK